MFDDHRLPLLTKVQQAEDHWLESSYHYLRTLFKGQKLVSHDQDHHFRAWMITKSLLQQKEKEGIFFSAPFIEALLIAVMFHDAGMSRTIDKRHGEESRKICEVFLDDQRAISDKYYKPMLNAIVHHDDKAYRDKPEPVDMTEDKWLLRLLCIADDLEAFGALGVFRYTEIYLLRGIPIAQLPQQVIDNLTSRFEHFISFFSRSKGLEVFHQRFHYIHDFFTFLLKEDSHTDHVQSSIIKMIESQLTGRYHDIHSVFSSRDPYITHENVAFLRKMEEECLELNGLYGRTQNAC